MRPLSSDYSRDAFETAADVSTLCQRLGDELSLRLRAASSAAVEVAQIVSELRALGHELYCWDSDGSETETWGGNYVASERTRTIVTFYYGEAEPASVNVLCGPWPARVPHPACQQCGEEMSPTQLRLRGRGHGQVDAPSILINLELGEAEPITASCGVRSVGIQLPALWCSKCNALWIRDVRAVGWTG
jgi:hypothetical protein